MAKRVFCRFLSPLRHAPHVKSMIYCVKRLSNKSLTDDFDIKGQRNSYTVYPHPVREQSTIAKGIPVAGK